MNKIKERYESAKELYSHLGVDVDKALEILDQISISIHCWQGDDVTGFLNSGELTGGIQVTGNRAGAARNATELRSDLEFVLSMVPGKHKVNLHAIYAESEEPLDVVDIKPEHFENWVNWAEGLGIGLDFNPTCFSNKMSATGYTLSSNDEGIRSYFVEHCKRSREVANYIAHRLGKKCVHNIWIPDGSKDIVVDKLTPRKNLVKSLDEIYSVEYDDLVVDTVESKLFGIGAESYTVGSNEFYMGYAVKNNIGVCLDAGHFHPTEVISDKISSVSLFTNEILLHVSRPVRWDSDHVVIFDDELREIACNIVRNNLLDRVHIGLDYFDASINRLAAWIIGIRSTQKALLYALLEPTDFLKNLEVEYNYTNRLAYLEEMKGLPLDDIYNYYCLSKGVRVGMKWISDAASYEEKVKEEREN